MSLPRIAKKVASSRSRSRKLVLSPLARRRLRAMGFVDDKHDWMMHGIGKELGTVNHEVLAPCSEPVTSASGFELVCSYNWIVRGDQGQPLRIRAPAWSGQPRPQIVVPGQAARLIPHRLPLRTSHHSRGQTFRDANVARSPRWPFEPMFRAAEVMRPDFKFDDVDVVINRNSLSILLKMAHGTCKDPFRLDLAMVQNTLIVTPLWEGITVANRRNYGRICEQVFTRPGIGLETSGSHHRAICYHLGPLRCVVLCEVDAAIPGFRPAMGIRNWTTKNLGPEQIAAIRRLTRVQGKEERNLFSGIMRTQSQAPPEPGYKHSSKMLRGGTGTLSSLTAELVTGTRPGAKIRRGKLRQMWLGRTPYSVETLHNRNVFTQTELEYMWPRLRNFEERSQNELQKLVTLIKTVKTLTANAKEKQSIAICTKSDRVLRVFEPQQAHRPSLPMRLQSRLWTTPWPQKIMKGVAPLQARAAGTQARKASLNSQMGAKAKLDDGGLAQSEATT